VQTQPHSILWVQSQLVKTLAGKSKKPNKTPNLKETSPARENQTVSLKQQNGTERSNANIPATHHPTW
jgi:hypothetical protein